MAAVSRGHRVASRAAAGCGETSGHGRAPSLSREEAMCPLCLDVLLRPVTMPCRHSVCLACFKRTVELANLCCPLCRSRISNWTRRRSREGTLVDAQLWERVRHSFPERCRQRLLEEEEGTSQAGDKPEDFIFRAPIKISKPGERREEYESQLKKFSDQLSDSENEEPFRGRTAHRSAFSAKGNASQTSLAGNTNIGAERSRSCSDAMKDGRTKSRRKSSQSNKVKASSLISASPAGVLLSTENSRSFSAPDLTLEKRPSGTLSCSMVQKTERSISPESNDSISEELNHFKPIVCSPCTPPKKLPNGKVLRPVIIKSTPRNLRRNLQSPTSYKTSNVVLQKWDAIIQDRQSRKTLSQGTLVSFPLTDDIPSADGFTKKKTAFIESFDPCKGLSDRISAKSVLPSDHLEVVLEDVGKGKAIEISETLMVKDHTFLLPDTISHRPSKSRFCSEADMNTKSELFLQTCKVACRKCPLANPFKAENQTGNLTLAKGKRLHRHRNNCQQTNMRNGTCGVVTDIGTETPSQRRGQKRRCKTKHLDQKGSLKRLKQMTNETSSVVNGLLQKKESKRLQEEEDRKLAFHLQRVLNGEIRTVNRRKGSEDQYPLRSTSTMRSST
ncbi:E3 ubiquitin-protein ligase RNF169 isoform X2 [Ambystoma mexicanum]|uniref:E3 ubiquitin-protein ligase RNF169 isoform X2 n=1 Tax=Ambystoma mexicanum TaxID=8296 RepID=UPI0037E8F9A5